MRRFGVAIVAICLGGCAFSREVERDQQLRLQEFEGRIADLDQRVAFEVAEKEAALRKLDAATTQVSTLQGDLAAEKTRSEDAGARLRACSDRGTSAQDELEGCGKARTALEAERQKLRSDMEAASAGWSSQAQTQRREMEECRGKVADLEAQAALLAAESRKEGREQHEQIEEISSSYNRLVADAKRELQECRGRSVELQTQEAAAVQAAADCAARLTRADETARAAAAAEMSRQEETANLVESLQAALQAEVASGAATIESRDGTVIVALPFQSVFAPRTLDLRSDTRDVLRRVSSAEKASERRFVVRARVEEERASGELGKKYPSAWALSAAAAGRVARFLEKEAGVDPSRVSALGEGVSAGEGGPGIELELVPPERPADEGPAAPPGVSP